MAKNALKLVYKESEEGWTGTVLVAALSDCAIVWSVDGESIDGPHKPERSKSQREKLPVVLLSEDSTAPGDVQRQSLQTFLAKQDAICKKLLKFGLQEISELYYDELLPPLRDCNGKQKTIRKKFDTVAGFQELIEPTGIFVLEDEKNGVAYIAVDFNTALDEEHGFSILLHDGKPLGWAGSGEMGGDIPPEITASEKGDFQAELLEYADAASQLAEVLKLATNPSAAAKIVDQIPPLAERFKASQDRLNTSLNSLDHGPQMAAFKVMQKDAAVNAAAKKLEKQTRRIALDTPLCDVLDPAMTAYPDWDRYKSITREFA